MKPKAFYSKSFLLFIRIVSVFFVMILLYLTAHAFYDVFVLHDYPCLFGLIFGPLSLVILGFVFVNPEKLALFVPSLLFFSISNSIGNSNPAFPIIFMELAVLLLWIRGFFKTHRTLKILALVFVYVIPLLFNLRLGWNIFAAQLFDIIQIILISSSTIFILYEYLKTQSPKDKVLNIADYSETTERDAKWLELVQQGTKYEAIAIDYELTLGTVQNRLNKIYHILETGDRIGFLSIYANAKIVYQK
ncbi:MAG: hypothetical protein J6P07_08875 [Spirochaetaceae bacterium]|nr:hypothetical protein [Spirochaetaceae bacterium]